MLLHESGTRKATMHGGAELLIVSDAGAIRPYSFPGFGLPHIRFQYEDHGKIRMPHLRCGYECRVCGEEVGFSMDSGRAS
jgi:hypothetical protein